MGVRQSVLTTTLLVVALIGCGRPTGPQPAERAAPLTGQITVDGSSTMLPMTTAIVDLFRRQHPNVQVTVQTEGTGGGLRRFCSGDVDIAAASRPIDANESRDCATNHVEYIELPVAFDSIVVVVHRSNDFVRCLTIGDLRSMWEPRAAGQVVRWNQVRATYPARPLTLFGPGTDSGTFDYFTLAITGMAGQSRRHYTATEDDEAIARAVAADPNALGYFGYAYYREHADSLALVAIDNGRGCTTPGPDTVLSRAYEPLSRPVFIYVAATAARRNEANAFAQTYVDPQHAEAVERLGYVPLSAATLVAVSRRLANGTTGSIFGGRGAVLGLTTDTFRDDDRIKDALVQ